MGHEKDQEGRTDLHTGKKAGTWKYLWKWPDVRFNRKIFKITIITVFTELKETVTKGKYNANVTWNREYKEKERFIRDRKKIGNFGVQKWSEITNVKNSLERLSYRIELAEEMISGLEYKFMVYTSWWTVRKQKEEKSVGPQRSTEHHEVY